MVDPKKLKEWKKSIPINRAGRARDMADAVMCLPRNQFSYTGGEALRVDGGHYT